MAARVRHWKGYVIYRVITLLYMGFSFARPFAFKMSLCVRMLTAIMVIPIGLTSIFLFLVASTPVIASHFQQHARRDSTWDDLSGPLWEQFVDGVSAPAAGIVRDGWNGILDEFVGPDTPGKSPPNEQPIQPLPGEQPERVNLSEPKSAQPPANSPSIAPQTRSSTDGHECDSTPVGAPDDEREQCGVGLRKIIYTVNCADTSQNVAIEGILSKTVQSGTRISTILDDDCGVICWTGELTEEGAEEMRRLGGVLAVVPDVILHDEDYISKPYVPTQKRDDSSHSGLVLDRRKFVKREIIVRQTYRHSTALSFVSTPEGSSADDCDYVYYSAAGQQTTVYVVDTGVDPSNSEFRSGVIKRWLYAWDTYRTPAEVPSTYTSGHGSCVASKVAGRFYGVAKKTSLIIVKHTASLSSFVHAIALALNDLRRQTVAGTYRPGYTIVTVQRGFRGPDEIDKWTLSKLSRQISKLISTYGIVFVASAGNTGYDAGTVGFPATLSPKLPIIVVGTTDEGGIELASSSRGPQVTVSAPGRVMCADNKPGGSFQIAWGTSFAAPAVAALAAYFLSLPDVGPMLRKRPTEQIPEAVKDYIVKAAYVRPGSTVLSIWNLQDGTRPLSTAP